MCSVSTGPRQEEDAKASLSYLEPPTCCRCLEVDEWMAIPGHFPRACPDFSGVDICFPLLSGYDEAGSEKSHL